MAVYYAILIFGIGIPIACSTFIALFIAKSCSSRWYKNLRKPAGYPPDSLFPILLVILSAMMASASTIVWCSEEKYDRWGLSENRLAIIGYLVQFFLTNLWPVVFFIGHKVTISLIQLVIADAVLLFCAKLCCQVDTCAGFLVLPQLVWTTYCAILMYSIWLVNYNTQQTDHEKLLSAHHPPAPKYGVYV